MLWISTQNFAAIATINRSSASRLLKSFVGGRTKPWRGVFLEVRTVKGQGGKCGIQYLVKTSSLPLDMQEGMLPKHRELRPIVNAQCLTVSGRKRRADRGKSRVFISRKWDNAIQFPDISKENIARDLENYRNGLWKDGAQRKIIKSLCTHKLVEYCLARSVQIPKVTLHQICKISNNWVLKGQVYRQVAEYYKDHRIFDSKTPIADRTVKGLRPMEVVVADVHPMDVLVTREDGTTGTARIICWLDVATARVHLDMILVEGRGDVRQTDIGFSLINSWTRSDFGCAQIYQLDNGSEYKIVELFKDALSLVRDYRNENLANRASQIIYSIAYNAKAKRAELFFKHLEQHFFSTLPGYIGGNRMASRLRKRGKVVLPFDGTFTELSEIVQSLVDAYHNMPVGGNYGNRTPNEILNEHIDNGWEAVVFEPKFALAVGCKVERRRLNRGCITLPGISGRYVCDELLKFRGSHVWVHISKLLPENNEVRIDQDANGTFLGIAKNEGQTHYLDQNAAAEISRRRKVHVTSIRDLAKSAPDISAKDELISFGNAMGNPIPNKPDAVIIPINQNPKFQPNYQLPPASPQPEIDVEKELEEERAYRARSLKAYKSKYFDN